MRLKSSLGKGNIVSWQHCIGILLKGFCLGSGLQVVTAGGNKLTNRIYGFSGHLKWPVVQYKTMESLTEPARPRFEGLKKYLKHVNHGLSAVTFISKSYFLLLEITATQ